MLPTISKANSGRSPPKTSTVRSIGYSDTVDSADEFTAWRDSSGASSDKKFATTYLRHTMGEGDDKFARTGTVREAEVTQGGGVVSYFGSEQYLINKELKRAVAELQNAAEGMHEGHHERCIAMKEDTDRMNNQIFQEVVRFQQQMKWDSKIGLGVADVCEEMQLLTSPASFEDLGPEIKVPPIYALVPTLNELLIAMLRPARLEQVMAALGEIIFPLTGNDELVEQVRMVHKMVHTDVLKLVAQELAKSQPIVAQLHRDLEVTERERQMALQLNNIPEATEKHLKSVDLLEKLIVVIRERLHELMTGSGDPQTFFNLLGGLRKGMVDDLQALKEGKAKLKEMLAKDVDSLQRGIDQKLGEEEQHLVTAKKQLDRSADRLEQLLMQQDAVWGQVLDLVDKLKTLGEEHTVQTNAHIRLVEEEAKHQQTYAELMETSTSHLAYLHDAMKHTDAALTMISALEDYFNQATQRIHDKHIEESLAALKVKEMQHYCDVVRQYGLIAGDLLDRKEKRLAGTKKLLRTLDFGTEMATEALDDDLEKYERDTREYRLRADQLQREMVYLRYNLDNANADFKATEEMLEEAGIDFKPPSIEMQEALIDKKKNFLERRRQVLFIDQKELDGHSTEIRKLDSQVRSQQDIVAERREQIKTRKCGSPSAADASPTSPAGGLHP
eukprot:GGOE01062188.1.p1 GENE.GGOE01062188.1~~GGOE01062188.1.p1  ORF type:complete len:672 (-),score=285.90 GGOE01062188.1:287-2302(-)